MTEGVSEKQSSLKARLRNGLTYLLSQISFHSCKYSSTEIKFSRTNYRGISRKEHFLARLHKVPWTLLQTTLPEDTVIPRSLTAVTSASALHSLFPFCTTPSPALKILTIAVQAGMNYCCKHVRLTCV